MKPAQRCHYCKKPLGLGVIRHWFRYYCGVTCRDLRRAALVEQHRVRSIQTALGGKRVVNERDEREPWRVPRGFLGQRTERETVDERQLAVGNVCQGAIGRRTRARRRKRKALQVRSRNLTTRSRAGMAMRGVRHPETHRTNMKPPPS